MERGKVKVEVEYHLLDGRVLQKHKFLAPTNRRYPFSGGMEVHFAQYAEGDFVSQTTEEPQGMFIFAKIYEAERRFVLKQVGCNPSHWKGDEKGRAYGPDKKCRQKCEYYPLNCAISAHIITMADSAAD